MERQAEAMWRGGPVFLQAEHARLTTDSVLLADFARVSGSMRGADLGCASGVLMLLLLCRESGIMMTGMEVSPEAAALAGDNLRLNAMEDRADILCGDFRVTAKTLKAGSFDFIITNPPYFEAGRGAVSPDRDRAAARTELNCSLKDVFAAASRLCRSGGRFFLCYRPDGLNRLFTESLAHRMQPKRLRFVHHSPGKDAALVLVECRKDGNPGLTVGAPLILFTEEGRETEEYRRIYHR